MEPQPTYNPGTVGSLSPQGQWTLTNDGWTPSGGTSGGQSSVMDMINNLLGNVNATPVETPTIPKLDFQFPSGADIQGKWKEFLDMASKAPDIVNYYKNLLDQAKGDTELAKSFIERDYSMGLRQTKDTLQASLEKLGVTSTQEQQAQQGNLNQRGIALTDQGGGKVAYAGGGQAGQEVGQLGSLQKLRQEAEVRSASQGIEKSGLAREKGLTNVGQGLQQYGLQLQGQKQYDVYNRANQGFNVYQQGQNADLMKAQQKQSDATNNPSSSGSSQPRSHINPATGVWDDNYFSGGVGA